MGPDADFLLQCLPWGVVVLDVHGTVLRLNQQAADWWGAPQQDLVGKRLEQLPAGTLPADLLQALRQVTSSPAQPSGEFFLPRHQQWITMSSVRHTDDWVVYWQDVTAQKQRQDENETQQAASDSLLGRTEAVARTGSYELELATGRFHFSDGLYRLFGEEPGAFVPEMAFINSRSHPDDVAGVQQVLAQAIADCQPYHYQRRIYRSDGQLRTLEVHGRVECDALGQPMKLLGLLQDVTEREQAAQELLQAKDELARRATDSYVALYNSMDEGFCIIEVLFDAAEQPFDYRFLDVNPAFEQQSGLREVLGKTMRELAPAHEQHWFDAFGRVARTGKPTRFEAEGAALGRWFDVNAFSIGPPQHRHVAVLFADITERKRTEEALRQSEARYRSLFTNMEQSFCLMEKIATAPHEPSDYRYLVVNPAFGRHTGLVVAAGQTIREMIPGIEPHIMAIYDEVVASGEPQRFETYVAGLDQWFEAEVVPEAQPGHLAVLFSNVSVRRRAEQTLRESEARRAYLLALSDALRPIADAVEGQAMVTNTVLEHFQADRYFYSEIDGDTITVRQDVTRPGLLSVAGVYSFSEMPIFNAMLRQASLMVVPDVNTSPVMDDNLKQLCRDLQILAYINVPVTRHGQVVGNLCISQCNRREWTALECALLQETAERTWTAVEQARAEEALRQSEEQFRLLVTATSDTVYRMSADWTQMEQLIGKDFLADTLDPTPDWMEAYVPDEDLPLVQTTIAEAIRHQHVLELEHRVRRADGTIGWTYSRAIPVFNARGELTGWLGTASDVSARKAAEEALRVSEAKYRALFETMDQGFGIVEVLPAGPGRPADFRWLEVNPQVERLTGIAQADLLRDTTRNVLPELEDIWYERYERVALTGEPVRFEQHVQVLGRWFDVYAYPLEPDGPKPYRVALLFTNFTARKEAEEALRHAEEHHRERLEQQVAERTQALGESQARLQSVFNSTTNAVVLLRAVRDAAGGILDFEYVLVNPVAQAYHGSPSLIGRRYRDLLRGTQRQAAFERLAAVVETGLRADFEAFDDYEGRNHWFRLMGVKLDDGLLYSAEDITVRKLLEQAQTQSLALLRQSEAVAVMGSWEYDLESQEFTWSDGLYHLFELPVGGAVELQFFLDTVLDDDRPAAAKLVRTLTTGTASFDTTLRMHVGQAVKTVRFKAVPIPDAPGTPVRMLGVCLDVSDVQRLEAENLALKLDRHKELLLAILQAQETERQRLGEVLHNGLGQILYATKLRLDQLDTPALQALPALAGLHQQTGRLLADAMRQTRTLAHELVPTSLADFGLAAAVCDVCRDLSTPQLRIMCHVWGEELPLPQPVQVTLFRLAQELAHNIVRHAGATEAMLELETLPGGVSLRAEDNGHGFDPLTAAEGLGLRTVRQAVALLGGTVAVDSSPEFGTHVRLRIPLPLFT
ncbi:hypothetical protein GCM10011495_22200 [Hymenobacter frigidus]|uniref:histidine kinase n=2 Tax=Hymenobacter frigidus TaxID=1524095 RepID=A0ABQ2A8A0_9BACT|nr:hypothetical protein GCM10011495_22200 [Hymenobacter frigidus]